MFLSVSAEKGGVSRRSVMFGGASALAIGVLARSGMNGALAQEASPTPATGTSEVGAKTLKEKLEQYGYLWAATSPATHLGDVFTLTATNTGTAPVNLWVFTIVMDHRNHHNEAVIQEELELAVGESREVMATNEHGTANHFTTHLASDAGDASALTLDVTIIDGNGQVTASFNQRAFMIDSREGLKQAREERRAAGGEKRGNRRKHGDHAGHEEMDSQDGGGADDEMDVTTDVTETESS
ncbi:MAG: hypothetical protein QOF01_1076 [Thermomicrobiales bacterium]|jgi:hypothetical protein|nr:hypothetical protein [Thermomicrobiales bacterium]